jgi:hypothetical protein
VIVLERLPTGGGRVFVEDVEIVHGRNQYVIAIEAGLVAPLRQVRSNLISGVWVFGSINPCFVGDDDE